MSNAHHGGVRLWASGAFELASKDTVEHRRLELEVSRKGRPMPSVEFSEAAITKVGHAPGVFVIGKASNSELARARA